MDEPLSRAAFNGSVLDGVRKEFPQTTWRADGNSSVFTHEDGGEKRTGTIVFKNQSDDTPVDLILEPEGEKPRGQAAIDGALLTGPGATARMIIKHFGRPKSSGATANGS